MDHINDRDFIADLAVAQFSFMVANPTASIWFRRLWPPFLLNAKP